MKKHDPRLLKAIIEHRRRRDPLATYKPGKTQAECYKSRATFRMLGGPSRGGKTIHAAVEIAECSLRRHPFRTSSVNGIYLVFAISREQLTDVWYGKLRGQSRLMGPGFDQPLIPDCEVVKDHKTQGAGRPTIKEIELKNGNRILFAVSGDKHVWKRIQGKDFILGIVIDEQAGTQDLIDECVSRMLDANGNAEIKERTGGAWFLWPTTETMVNDAHHKMKALCQSGDPHFAYFEIDPRDNPAITMEAREAFKSVLSEDAYKTRMMGTGTALMGRMVYPQFDDHKHVLASDYTIQDTDTIWIGYDPGTNYTGIVIAAFSKDAPHQLKVVQCFQPHRQTIQADVIDIANFLRGRFIEALVYDQAARKQDKVGTSVMYQLQQELTKHGVILKRGMLMGQSRYEEGVPAVRRWLANPSNPDAPPQIVLNNSPASGVGRLRQQIKAYRFSENAVELKGDNIVRGDDHLLDALRYLVTRNPSWIDRGPNRMNPAFGQLKKHDTKVWSDAELLEKQKMDWSAQIARGKIPRVIGLRR